LNVIDVSKYAKGIYFVKIEAENRKFNYKIIKL
jgi:hypothetical protein